MSSGGTLIERFVVQELDDSVRRFGMITLRSYKLFVRTCLFLFSFEVVFELASISGVLEGLYYFKDGSVGVIS